MVKAVPEVREHIQYKPYFLSEAFRVEAKDKFEHVDELHDNDVFKLPADELAGKLGNYIESDKAQSLEKKVNDTHLSYVALFNTDVTACNEQADAEVEKDYNADVASELSKQLTKVKNEIETLNSRKEDLEERLGRARKAQLSFGRVTHDFRNNRRAIADQVAVKKGEFEEAKNAYFEAIEEAIGAMGDGN